MVLYFIIVIGMIVISLLLNKYLNKTGGSKDD